MYKPLFFTAMMSLITCFVQIPAKAGSAEPDAHSAKPCPEGTVWDNDCKKCVRDLRVAY